MRKALTYLKSASLFTLPANTAMSNLARYFLAPNDVTKNHLFVLVNIAAAASAFGRLSVADLVGSESSILTEEILEWLGYNGSPPSAAHLLKRFRDRLEGNSDMPWHLARVLLRDAFAAILESFVLDLPLSTWRDIDNMSVGDASSAGTSVDGSVYFALDNERGQDRRRRSIFALYSLSSLNLTKMSSAPLIT